MNKTILIVLLLSILNISQACNATHFDYISTFTLGKQD